MGTGRGRREFWPFGWACGAVGRLTNTQNLALRLGLRRRGQAYKHPKFGPPARPAAPWAGLQTPKIWPFGWACGAVGRLTNTQKLALRLGLRRRGQAYKHPKFGPSARPAAPWAGPPEALHKSLRSRHALAASEHAASKFPLREACNWEFGSHPMVLQSRVCCRE